LNLRTVFHWLIPIILGVVGGVIFLTTRKSIPDLGGILTGFVWTLIPYFFHQSITYKIKNHNLVTKLLRLYDPLRGTPQCESNGIRYYNSQAQLPTFNSILEMKGLKQIDILSITSNLLLIGFNKRIEEALDKGIVFNFLLLNPKSENVKIQSQNFGGGKNLDKQIIDSLEILTEIKSNIDSRFKNNLSIKLYNKQIGKGIMRVQLEKESWIKVQTYIIGSDSSSRNNEASYEKDNVVFYKNSLNVYNKITNEAIDFNDIELI